MKLRQARSALALVLVFVAICTTVVLRRRPLPLSLFPEDAPPRTWSAKALGREQRPLLFLTRAACPPFSWVPPGAEKPCGLDVDVARAVAAELGVDVKVVAAPRKGMESRLLAGEADVLVVPAITSAANRRLLELSTPCYRSRAVLLLPVGERERFGEGVPGDITFAALVGSPSFQALRQRGGPVPVAAPGWEELLSCLREGRCGAALVDVLAVHHLLSRTPGLDLVLLPATSLVPRTNSVHMAVPRGASDLRRALDGALRDIRMSGTLRRIHRRYYPFDIE
jgi:polar amino acid transport system substrate-binding protein